MCSVMLFKNCSVPTADQSMNTLISKLSKTLESFETIDEIPAENNFDYIRQTNLFGFLTFKIV